MNSQNKITKYFIAASLMLCCLSISAYADVVVVVNPGSGVSKISTKQAKSIFLGKSKKLPDGSKAIAVEQSQGNPVRAIFLKKVLKKSESKLTAYWSKKVFSGKATPPKQLDDDSAVKAFVNSNAGAIGYIDSANTDASVKPVLTIK